MGYLLLLRFSGCSVGTAEILILCFVGGGMLAGILFLISF